MNAAIRALVAARALAVLALAAVPVATGAVADDALLQLDVTGRGLIQAAATVPAEDGPLAAVDRGPLFDGTGAVRLMVDGYVGDAWSGRLHAETIATGGSLRQRLRDLGSRFGTDFSPALDDDRRLVDLTLTRPDRRGVALIHRIDRLSATREAERGFVRLGRQAVTWGNGLVFNPMDLFNPFAPTDVVRDFKVGDDIALGQIGFDGGASLEGLVVARREPVSGDVRADQFSFGVNHQRPVGSSDVTLIAARHFDDWVIGAGATGTAFEGIWRADLTWTLLEDESGQGRASFPSAVVNYDRSWVWFGLNWYGLAEVHLNGLGASDPARAARDPAVTERFARGELFVLGRVFTAATLDVEVHPLVRLQAGAIVNSGDGSGLLQPRIVWSATQNLEVLAAGQAFFGGAGTEFGGFSLAGSPLGTEPSPGAFLRVSYFF